MNFITNNEKIEDFGTREYEPHELELLVSTQLRHALDGHVDGLKPYESLKSLDEIIGTQYGDRVLLELIQNAHDAHHVSDQGEIAIKLFIEDDKRGMLLVANRGRSFNFSNLDALRNIGISNKEIGEGIGNKGLGFRSVEALTDDPRIYSQCEGGSTDRFRGYCFRFATVQEIEERLRNLPTQTKNVVSHVANNIPRYLVPLPISEQSDNVLQFARNGFATVVEIPLRSTDAVNLAKEQVSNLQLPDVPIHIFLERIKVLNLEIHEDGEESMQAQLTRRTSNINASSSSSAITLHKVNVGGDRTFLVVRNVLPEQTVIEAILESIAKAPAMKRWKNWKGDAVVSVAVDWKESSVGTPRLFNFLPMGKDSKAPLHGFVDGPFFADIDRRSMEFDLPLNRYLLEAVAESCAVAAQTIVSQNLSVPRTSVVDLIVWESPHIGKIVDGFSHLDSNFTSANVWPIVAGGGSRWGNLDILYAWPDVKTKHFKPRRLAKEVGAAILPSNLGENRLARIRELSIDLERCVDLESNVLCEWVEGAASVLALRKRVSANQWRDFYDDVVRLFDAAKEDLTELQGKAFLKSKNGSLLQAPDSNDEEIEPVFVRSDNSRKRRVNSPPKPPRSLYRRLKFLDDKIRLSEETIRRFEKTKLVRQYDAVQILGDLSNVVPKKATENQRREALRWAFEVWQTTQGRAVEQALRKAKLFVPTLSGWSRSVSSFFSASWTNTGRLLEPYLCEAAAQSADCELQRAGLLISYSEWPVISPQDRKADWIRFLEIIAVRDGLCPIAGNLRRKGTPSNYWKYILGSRREEFGLDETWINTVGEKHFNYPLTEYHLRGECWRIPGQLEHQCLPQSAKEYLSDLVLCYLEKYGDSHYEFRISHWRDFETVTLPSPLQVFLREAEWMRSFRRDETEFRRPRETWSTQTARQFPPRFVDRFGSGLSHNSITPPLLFDDRIGLKDWASAKLASERLVALANTLSDLSASERRDLRTQLRRAWADIAEDKHKLPEDIGLVVTRYHELQVSDADPDNPQDIFLTNENQGFVTDALIDQGAAVLDVGDADNENILELLEQTEGFSPRIVESSDVRLIVDDDTFEPSNLDPVLISGSLNWLSDTTVLAHEFLARKTHQ